MSYLTMFNLVGLGLPRRWLDVLAICSVFMQGAENKPKY